MASSSSPTVEWIDRRKSDNKKSREACLDMLTSHSSAAIGSGGKGRTVTTFKITCCVGFDWRREKRVKRREIEREGKKKN